MLLLGLGAISLVFYALIRALFLIWNYPLYQHLSWTDWGLGFFHGIRFDLNVIAWLMIPAFLLQIFLWLFKIKNQIGVLILFVLLQVPFLIVNLGDLEYVQFTGRRFTLDQWKVAAEVQGKFWVTIASVPLLSFLGVLVPFLFIAVCFFFRKRLIQKAIKLGRYRELAIGIAGFLVIGIMARGGLQTKPINFAHGQVFANPSLNQLTLNSTFTFMQSLKRTPLPREHWMPTAEMLKWMNGSLLGESHVAKVRPEGAQNVVILILESFSLEHMGKIHGDRGYSPFLDELAEKSLFFPNAFANARRSIEGIGAILGGIPALMSEPFISSQYATNEFFGIGTSLAAKGYSSVFYHGGHNGTMYFDQFARSAGIQRYYGANEYGRSADDDGTWGIWDEPFLLNMVQDLKKQPEPFAVSLFTLSSHSPFKVPPGDEGKFPKGTSEVHEVTGYTDAALRKFFEAASKEPWYSRTLFIITGDHTFKSTRPQYQNDLGNYRVPLIFFHPGIQKWPEEIDRLQAVQQIDILPSIQDFLGIQPTQENLMGRSVFKSGNRYVVLASDGNYWLVTKDHVLMMDAHEQAQLELLAPHLAGEKPRAKDSFLERSMILADLKKKLFATRQYFSEGLWDNKLYFPSGR